MLRALGGFDAERGVTARAAAVRNLVAQLFCHGQREEPLEAIQAPVDERLVDPVVLDDDEAVFRVRRGDVLRELRAFGGSRASSVGTASDMGGLLCLPGLGL